MWPRSRFLTAESHVILWIFGVVAAVFTLAVCLFLFGPSIKSYTQAVPFKSDQWKANLESSDNLKQKVVSDLLSRFSLEGMSSDEIEMLLGKPPETEYFKDYDYVYWKTLLGIRI